MYERMSARRESNPEGCPIITTTGIQVVVRFAPRTVSDDDSGCLTETDESLSRQTHTVSPPDLCAAALCVSVPVPLALYTDKEGGGEEERERGGEDGQIRNRGLRLSRS